jgi:peptidoglycan/LPS O-acetylase OafA/YrhL
MHEPTGRVAPWDGVRAACIALVLWEHAFEAPIVSLPGIRTGPVFVGSMGVLVFFVLSGILITGLLADEWRARGSISLRGFYWRRFLRIVPPAAVFLVILAVGASAGWWRVPSTRQWVHLLTWTVNYFKPPSEASHLWSLSVEEQFYLVWPVLLLTLGIARARRVLVPLVLLPPLLRVAAFQVSAAAGESMWHRTEGVVDALAIGALVALAAEQLTRSSRYMRFMRSAWPALLPVGAAIGALTTLFAQLWALCGQTIVIVCAALYLDWLRRRPATTSARVLSWAPAQWLGRISYSVYVFHLPIMLHVAPGQPWVHVALSIAAGHLSYHTIEAWARRWRTRGPGALPVAAVAVPS